MLLTLAGETLIARAWRIACAAFGPADCMITVPEGDMDGPLGAEIERLGARTCLWPGDEADVLGRFHAAAHWMRWHPDSIIVRYTPDDWNKSVLHLRASASGTRQPVELGGEAFTLAQLDIAQQRETRDSTCREHITHALFQYNAPDIAVAYMYESGISRWSIDTMDDYEAAKAMVGA